MIYSRLIQVILFDVVMDAGNMRKQCNDGSLGCSGALLAVREGLGLHHKEVGIK